DQVQPEGQLASRNAGAAGGDDWLPQIDAGAFVELAQRIAILERAIDPEDLLEGQVARAGNVAGAAAGPQLRLGGVESAGGTATQRLLAPSVEVAQHLFLAAHLRVVEARGEMALLQLDLAVLDRTVLRQPLGEPAIEDRDLARAEDAEHPPHPCRAHV